MILIEKEEATQNLCNQKLRVEMTVQSPREGKGAKGKEARARKRRPVHPQPKCLRILSTRVKHLINNSYAS